MRRRWRCWVNWSDTGWRNFDADHPDVALDKAMRHVETRLKQHFWRYYDFELGILNQETGARATVTKDGAT